MHRLSIEAVANLRKLEVDFFMDVLDLVAKIKMDSSEYDKGLNQAKSSAESAGSGMSGAFGRVASGVGSAMATMAKTTAVAVGAAATGIATLTKQSVASFAQYEQLVGGIETLFTSSYKSVEEYAEATGQSIEEAQAGFEKLSTATDTVMENASNAWKTAGIDANTYMDQAVSMSASLLQGLSGDTAKAAELTDVAITDMSDNVNKMGTTMEAVQNAYNGLAKQNYTMLDNLKLGYQGTASEMARLINDSGVMGDTFVATAENVKEISYDKYIEAIHEIQEEMGITGTTAKEATTTISGSANQMKAAWSNLVTGIADSNADLDSLMGNLVESLVGKTEVGTNGVETHVNGFIDNIIPVIQTALTSIGTLIEEIVPKALELLPTMINNVLPDVVVAATGLLEGIITSMSQNMDSVTSTISMIIDTILDLLPQFLVLGGEIISSLASGLLDNLDTVLEAAGKLLEMIVTGISQNAEKLASGATLLISKLITFLAENATLLINGAVALIEGITSGILQNLGLIIEAGIQLAMAVFEGLLQAIPQLLSHAGEIVTMICDALLEHTDEIFDAATTLFLELVEALPEITMALGDALQSVLTSLIELMTGDGSSEIYESALMMFLEVAAALPQILTSVVGALWEVLNAIFSAIGDAGQDLFVAACEFFMKINEAVTEKASEIMTSIRETISSWIDGIAETVSDWANAGRNLISGLWSGISDKAQWLYSQITGMGQTIVSKVKALFGIHSPSTVFAEIGKNLALGLGEGWDNNIDDVTADITKSLDIDTSINANAESSNGIGIGKGQPIYINLYATSEMDGKKVGEATYNFTVDKLYEQQRALAVAQGGYY